MYANLPTLIAGLYFSCFIQHVTAKLFIFSNFGNFSPEIPFFYYLIKNNLAQLVDWLYCNSECSKKLREVY